MFVLNDDNSIYATRGDIVFFEVSAEQDGEKHKFQPGDMVRIKVFGKKDASTVVLQKDFPVVYVTEKVQILLTSEDTKIGEVISKPKDYWYEVELNPLTNPQTIIGYSEDGPAIFKLFPEGADLTEYAPTEEDIPFVDDELDLTSARPVQNQAIAREIINLKAGYENTHAAVAAFHVTPQMYGAIGDGEADDTEAFVQAMAASKRIFVPAGDYLVKDLNIGQCEIIGEHGTNIKVSGVITISNTYYPRISNLCFTAVGESREALMVIDTSYYGIFESVQFSNYSGAVNVGVKLDGSDFCYYQAFRSCVFNNLPIGMKFNGFSNAHLVDKCEFYECATCVELDGAENVRLTNNCFQTFSVSGVKITKTGEGVPKSNLIMGNYFEASSICKDTTLIGDIDLSNHEDVKGNFIFANHYTYTKALAHVVNIAGNNLVIDFYTGQESNRPNTLIGLTALEVVTDAYKEYGGERFEGTIMPVREADGSLRYYVFGKTADGSRGWQRIITTGLSENDTVNMPPIATSYLAQYNGGCIQLGYDYASTADRAMTFDSNQQLIKMYNGTSTKWEYYQKVDSGTTANRPTWKPRGYQYFDSTLGKPVFSTGSNTWVDATGASV